MFGNIFRDLHFIDNFISFKSFVIFDEIISNFKRTGILLFHSCFDILAFVSLTSGHSSRYSSVEDIDVKNRVRARHETVNKRITQFSSLAGIFRHDLDAHSDLCMLLVLSPRFYSKWANLYLK